MVARELIVLAARELVVVVLLIVFVVWAARRFLRESRR
jgi:flagellar biogenesis protein FliO